MKKISYEIQPACNNFIHVAESQGFLATWDEHMGYGQKCKNCNNFKKIGFVQVNNGEKKPIGKCNNFECDMEDM